MKVSATLKGVADTHGRRTVYIRVAQGDQRTFKATNLKVHPKDFEKGKVKSSHPKYKEYNSIIRGKITEAESGIHSPGQKDVDLFSFIDRSMIEWLPSKKYSTLKRHRTEINKLKEFRRNPLLSNINHKWLQSYYEYCYELGNAGNTIWSSFKFLRMVMKKAVKEKLVHDNPFDLFTFPKYVNPEKIYLTRGQVESIDNLCHDPECPREIKFAANWFLIGCYTGLRYSDMQAFDKKKIKNDRLVLYTAKTGTPVSIPLSEKLKDLFERVQYKRLHLVNQHYNRLLKLVAEMCEPKIEERVSAHTSRHTFATLCASAGISQEVTAKLMGIVNLRTVAIYYKLTGTAIDAEYSKL